MREVVGRIFGRRHPQVEDAENIIHLALYRTRANGDAAQIQNPTHYISRAAANLKRKLEQRAGSDVSLEDLTPEQIERRCSPKD